MTDPTPSLATQPIYADRATGETYADARAMIDAYLKRYMAQFAAQGAADATASEDGAESVEPKPAPPLDLALDSAGYAQFEHGSATVGVNVLDGHGVLVIFSPIGSVPMVGREALYRRLLELSFLETSDAAFAINAPEDEIVVRCLRRLSALDYEEFEDLLNTVATVADKWDDLLVREYGP